MMVRFLYLNNFFETYIIDKNYTVLRVLYYSFLFPHLGLKGQTEEITYQCPLSESWSVEDRPPKGAVVIKECGHCLAQWGENILISSSDILSLSLMCQIQVTPIVQHFPGEAAYRVQPPGHRKGKGRADSNHRMPAENYHAVRAPRVQGENFRVS